jgi:Periplasmic component of the Tol biopolymer transport system
MPVKLYRRAFIFFILLSSISLIIFASVTQGQKDNSPYASAQVISEPQLFAEGVINIDGEEYGPTFMPDGKTIFFARRLDKRKMEHIFVSRFENGKWTAAEVAPFSGKYFDKEPFVSPDGKKIFFASRRPVDAASEKKDFNIWMVEKTKDGWSAPQNLGPMVNSDGYDNYPAVSKNGTIYFGSVRAGGSGEGDLYRSRLVKGKYTAAENLGNIINTAENEADPYIAPDESFIIYSAERANGAGEGDLFISFNKDGKWSAPQSLGPKINTSDYEYTPLVSPDKKYLFFSRGWGKIYQIDMSALNLKP